MMVGSTAQWWRAFVYLGAMATVRGELATYISPWVDKVNAQLGTQILATEAATFFCIPVAMAALVYVDGLLADIADRLFRNLMLLSIALIVLACFVLNRAEANGVCPALKEWGDLILCGPLAWKWVSDIARPFFEFATYWASSVAWISWGLWLFGTLPIMILAIGLVGGGMLAVAIFWEEYGEDIWREWRSSKRHDTTFSSPFGDLSPRFSTKSRFDTANEKRADLGDDTT
jgi:hypothetical protein